MGNPLFQMLGGSGGMSMPGSMGNFQKLLQQFQQFKQNFHGNPQEEVQKLISSGRINQQQLNQVQTLAKQFQQLM